MRNITNSAYHFRVSLRFQRGSHTGTHQSKETKNGPNMENTSSNHAPSHQRNNFPSMGDDRSPTRSRHAFFQVVPFFSIHSSSSFFPLIFLLLLSGQCPNRGLPRRDHLSQPHQHLAQRPLNHKEPNPNPKSTHALYVVKKQEQAINAVPRITGFT